MPLIHSNNLRRQDFQGVNKNSVFQNLHGLLSGWAIGQVSGKENFININKPFFASIRGSEIHHLVAKESDVVTQISVEVEVPSGKPVTLDVSEWYKIEGGEILSLKTYFDTAEFLNELKSV